MPDEEVANVKDADSYVLDFATNEGDQVYQKWYVSARNDVGESLLYEESGATILVGKPYDLPYITYEDITKGGVLEFRMGL